MINGIGGYNPYASAGQVPSIAPVFNYKAAQQQTKQLVDAYRLGNERVQTLKKDSANFLKEYTNKMNSLNSAASKLSGQNLDKLLLDKDGKVTDETVKKTSDALAKMVDEYNTNLKMLNKNADRGPGVMKQIARMADDPAPMASMKMVGVSVNKDGTLALDASKLEKALKTENEGDFQLYKSIISGTGGIADGIRKDAQAGLNASSGSLISGDIAQMRSIQQQDPIRSFATYSKGNAFTMNNMAAVGLLMNFAV